MYKTYKDHIHQRGILDTINSVNNKVYDIYTQEKQRPEYKNGSIREKKIIDGVLYFATAERDIEKDFVRAESSITQFISIFTNIYHLELDKKDMAEFIYFLRKFPFAIHLNIEDSGTIFNYTNRENVYFMFYENLVKRTFDKSDTGYNEIKDYFMYLVRQFNTIEKISVNLSQYKSILQNFTLDKDVDLYNAIRIVDTENIDFNADIYSFQQKLPPYEYMRYVNMIQE